MKSIVQDSAFFYLISICLLLIIVVLMAFRLGHGDHKAGRFLLGYFVSYLYLSCITYYFVYGDASRLIHLLRSGHPVSLLIPVLAFFYIKQCLYPAKLQWKDLWHLLPLCFFIVDFAPFFMQSATEKLRIFKAMDAVEYRIGFSQGWLVPQYGHIVIRTVLMLGYWIAQLRLLMLARSENYHPLRLQYPFTWRWLHIFLFTEAFFFLLPLVGALLQNSQLQAVIFSMAAAGTMAIQCFYLLLHPEILFTQPFQKEGAWKSDNLEKEVPPVHSPKENLPQTDVSSTENWIENKFSEADLIQIEAKIRYLMDTQRPYEKQGYSLHEFAVDSQISPQKLSSFINSRYGKNLNDYLNNFRLARVKEKLQAGEYHNKTLEAIAFECGFQSRSTFIRAFKKENGITPSDYLKNISQ